MASFKETAAAKLAALRARHRGLDHAIRTQEHVSSVKASQQAGAVTYFGFLSVFPVLALSFFAVGYVSRVFPEAQDTLLEAIDSMFPNLVGPDEGQLDLADIQDSASAIGLVGLAGVLYSGLGWLSALRQALIVVFVLPEHDEPNFVKGKVRDLITLVVIGSTLLIAVAATGIVAGFSEELLDFVGLSTELGWLVKLLTIALGLMANSMLFLAMFRLLAAPDLSYRALWSGALVGAVGFEVLKQASTLLISSTQGNPAFQVFGIALILVVWINYFSRVILYAAAWAETSGAEETDPVAYEAPVLPPADLVAEGSADTSPDDDATSTGSRATAVAKGAAVGVAGAAAAAAVVKARGRGDGD
jgi:membrane protein